VPHLHRVGMFVPETTTSIDALRGCLGLSEAQVRVHTRFLGQEKVAVADDRDLVELLVPAGEQAIAGTDRDRIRYLIYAHTMPFVARPGEPVLDRVRQRLGLANATVFGLSQQHCASALYAVRLAEYLLHDLDPADEILVMTGEKALSPRFRLVPGITVMGDASAAFRYGNGPDGDEVLALSVRTLGRFYQCIDCPDDQRAEYVRIYGGTVIEVVKEALDRAGCDRADIALIAPHNVNTLSWRKIAQDFDIPLDTIYLDNVSTMGHCFGADPFVNLVCARNSGRTKPGDIVLLVAAGLGATFAAIVLRIGPKGKAE
jgi:3-oxoacyl-[acyl-carrier-protein] synthase III